MLRAEGDALTTDRQTYDIVIIGGGLVGLCIAFHLLDGHQNIAILAGTRQGCASLAAAGMLAPTCEWSPETPLAELEFLRSGRDYYKEFLRKVRQDAHNEMEIGYAEKPFLLVDLLESKMDLASRFAGLQAAGANVVWRNPQEVWELEPYLNLETLRGAIQVFGDGVVNPRALHRLLLEHISQSFDLLTTNLLAVEERAKKFVLSLTDGRTVACSQVIIAAGAWSFEVAEKFHLNVPVSPAKGQIVQLSGPPGLLQHIVYMPVGACGCLLERSPGVYIAGTSEEYISAEVNNTSKVIAAILTRINEVFLAAGDFVIDDMWSGFRPITPDELPIIGQSSDPRIIVATGHYRNGILLSPLTGLLVKSLIEGKQPAINIDNYHYQREFVAQYRYASAY